MKELNVQMLNECFNVNGLNYLTEDPASYRILRYPSSVGNNHPLWGTHKTQEQRQKQSEIMIEWWKNVSDNKREKMKNNLSKVIKSQWELLTSEERKTARKWKSNPKSGKDNPMYGKSSAVKGKVWITNGKDNMMVNPNKIPDGWYKGRVNVVSDDGKERLRHLTAQRNTNGELGWTAKKLSQNT